MRTPDIADKRATRRAGSSFLGENACVYRRPPKTFPRGRICAERGCRTVLSIYNALDRCSVHQEAVVRTFRARRRAA